MRGCGIQSAKANRGLKLPRGEAEEIVNDVVEFHPQLLAGISTPFLEVVGVSRATIPLVHGESCLGEQQTPLRFRHRTPELPGCLKPLGDDDFYGG